MLISMKPSPHQDSEPFRIPPLSSSPETLQPLTCFLSLWMNLHYQEFYVNALITMDLFLCASFLLSILILRFIHSVMYSNILFFLLLSSVILYESYPSLFIRC